MRKLLPLSLPVPGWTKNTCLALFSLFFVGFWQTGAEAQITLYNYTNASTGAPASVASGLAGTSLARGGGVSGASLTCVGATQGFGADGWPTTNTFDVDAFNLAGDFIEFTLDPDMGNSLHITGFTANSRRENYDGTVNDGPASLRYAYKTSSAGVWTFINPGNPQASNNCNSVGVQRIWNAFPVVSVGTTETITFRVYGLTGGANLTGDLFLRNIAVTGYLCSGTPSVDFDNPEACDQSETATLEVDGNTGDITSYSIDFDDPNIPDLGPVAVTPGMFPATIIIDISDPDVTPGAYDAAMTINNICGSSNTIDFLLTIHELPVVTCPADFSVCIDDPALALIGGAPMGGTYSGTGVSGGMFDPATAGVGTHTIMYRYDDPMTGCSDFCTFDITVHALPTVTCPPDFAVCVDEEPFTLTDGDPSGGSHSGSGVSYNMFNASTAGVGMHTITYTYTDVNGCTNSCNYIITVNPLPVVTCPPSFAVCIDEDPFELTGAEPEGGTYSGTGVDDGVFDPEAAGEGTHTITYVYTDENGCTSSCTLNVTVHPLPVLDCPDDLSVCLETAAFPLTDGDPAEGEHSGTGVSGGEFDPAAAGPGTHTITYTFTDENGCTNSCDYFITVYDPPVLEFSAQVDDHDEQSGSSEGPTMVMLEFCVGDFFSFTGFSTSSANVGMIEELTGDDNTTYNGNPILVPRPPTFIDPSEVAGYFNGGPYGSYGLSGGTSGVLNQTYTPYLDVNGNDEYDEGIDCLGETITLVYKIFAYPDVEIEIVDLELCAGQTPVITFLEPNFPDGTFFDITAMVDDGNGGGPQPVSFFDVFHEVDLPFFPNPLFNTATVQNIVVTGPGGCSVSLPDITITVHPLPIVDCPDDLTVCVLDDVFPLTDGDPAGGTHSGTGVDGGDFDPAAAGLGTHTITYTYTDGNSCTNTCEYTITVRGLEIESYQPVTLLRTICDGENTSFRVDFLATPDETVSATWQIWDGMNWVDLPITPPYTTNLNNTQDWARLNITGATNALHNNQYRVVFTTSVCTLASDPFLLEVFGPITIVDQPESVTICGGDAPQIAVFEADVDNPSGPLNLRWQWFNAGTMTWQNLPVLFGADTETLTLDDSWGPWPNTGDSIPIRLRAWNSACADVFSDTVYLIFHPSATPTLTGPSVVHMGSQIFLLADPGIQPPATLAGETWVSSDDLIATVDAFGIVTGVATGGPVTITYQVTDNAGCTATATAEITVIDKLKLTASPSDETVTCGETFDVTIVVDNFVDLLDLQYSVSWDPGQLTYLGFSATTIGGDAPAVNDANALANGELTYAWFTTGSEQSLPNGSVLLTLSFQSLANSGTATVAVAGAPTPISATNSSISSLIVLTMDGSVTINPIAIVLSAPTEICPVDCDDAPNQQVIFDILATTGNPDEGTIDWDAAAEAAGFPGSVTFDLDLIGNQIIVVVPCGLTSGVYAGQLTVTNTETGCTSINYSFVLIVDQTPPDISIDPVELAFTCPDDVPAPDINQVTATDDCEPVIVELCEESNNEGAGCVGYPLIIWRTYCATDAAGNTAYVTQTITVVDDVFPEIDDSEYVTGCYDTDQEAIDAVLAYAEAHKSDNCSEGGDIVVSFFDIFYDGCEATITVTAEDACNNLKSFEFDVIIDGEAPQINPMLIGLIDDCYEEAEIGDPLQNAYDAAIALILAAASDNCTDLELDNFSAAAVDPDDRCDLVIIVTVTDDCGKTATWTFETRVDSEEPTIQDPNPLALSGQCFETEEDAIAAAIAATTALDNCPGDIQYDGSVDPLSTCPYNVVVFATDFCGNFTSIIYENVFIDSEGPEVIDQTPDQTCFQTSDAAIDYLLGITSWSDNCTDVDDLVVDASYSNDSDPEPGDDCEMGTVTITVTDHCGLSNSVSYDVTIDNTPPTGTADPLVVDCLDDAPVDIGDVYDLEDNCGGMVIVEWVSDGAMDEDCSFRRTYSLTDACGNVALLDQTIDVNDTEAPEWDDDDNAETLFADCGDTEALDDALLADPPAVTDNCEVVEVVESDPVYEYSLICDDNYTITITWTAYDPCGNSSTFTRTIEVSDTEDPTFSPGCQFMPLDLYTSDGYDCPEDAEISLEIGQQIHINTTWFLAGFEVPALTGCVFDNCSDPEQIVITVESIVIDDELPCQRTITVSFRLTDACGNEQDELFVCIYNIHDNTAPVFPSQDDLNEVVSCSDDAALDAALELEPTVSDYCDPDAFALLVDDATVDGDCAGEYVRTRTWVASDNCGNSSTETFTQTITVIDNEAPEFEPGCQFMPLNLLTSGGYDCPEEAEISLEVGQQITVSTTWFVAGFEVPSLGGCVFDNCSDPEDLAITVESIENVYDPETCSRTITVSFRLADACGNVQSELFVCIYNIYDDTDPEIVFQGELDPCYEEVAQAEADAIAATAAIDNCDEDLTYTATTSFDEMSCEATITVTVADCAGNTATAVYTTRIDNVPPTVIAGTIAPSYPSVAAAQAAAQAATTATDNCPGALDFVVSTVGTCEAIITVTVTDGCGNASSVTYLTSIVQDAVTVDCPDNAIRDADAQCVYVVDGAEFDPAVSGGCEIVSVVYTLSMATSGSGTTTLAGATLNKGTTLITWTVTDENGGTAICTFTVTVNDTQLPAIVCPAAITVNNNAAVCGATVTYTAPVGTDNCMVTTAQTGGLPSGSFFPVGTTVNGFTATDMSGNTAFCSFNVTVIDNQPPAIVCPANISVGNDPGQCSAVVNYTVTATDNCPGVTTTLTGGLASGAAFPLGSTTVSWKATDGAGLMFTCSFVVVVNDTEAPAIVCPPNITVNADGGGCTAVVNEIGGATATDNCPGVIAITNTGVPPGNVYSGTTTIVWKATDVTGNMSTCIQTVTVVDNEDPTITCPVSGTATRSTNVNDCFYTVVGAEFNAAGADNCSAPTVTYTLSGATTGSGTSLTGVALNKGLTTIVWTATDGGGNTATCSFAVQVNDTRPPVVSCPPNQTVNAPADACSAVVNPGALGATDNCGAPTTTFGPIPMGNVFPIGMTILTGTAADASGNTAMCTTKITVLDVTPPTVNCPSNVTVTPGEGNCTANYNPELPNITEACGINTITWTMSGATTGSGIGDPPATTFEQGTTTITYVVTDANGNTASCSFTVFVNCIKISGKIIWEHDRILNPWPVQNATVKLSGSTPTVTTLTNAAGMYMLSATDGTNLIITPTKPAANTAQKLNGVTSADATAIQQHVAGIVLITDPYKQLAADVNHSNIITTTDASIITGALAGNPLALAAFDTSWRFVPTTYALPTPPWAVLPIPNKIFLSGVTTDQTNQDFIGVKIGNVNGSAMNPALSPISPLQWILQDRMLEAGQEFEVVFTAAQFAGLASYQFALDFDPSQMEMLEIQPLGALPLNLADHFGTYNLDNGEIRAVWANATGISLADGTPVFRIRFKALTSGAKLSEVLQLNEAELQALAFNETLQAAAVQLSYTDLATSVTDNPWSDNAPVQLLQNRPNPFVDETAIGFILPEACEARLRIFDGSGREITSYQRQYSAGYHEVVFRLSNASAYGLLYYELTTPSGRLVKKMVATGK